ncbi:glycoside hydrolase family 65 protein [Phaeodactylibacter luteus]|uniref:Glycoside hydrolase family 65 protein n=1 Tax=Phaeodactylibacter luteus TaxID=1564516 RepID=A0A5C6RIH8_9BACT|nr:glycoside hydrolase family 65 protein [Phaeodactylibacter luteus]TXB62206.1 glycoside hydrolase family 65 protein [Phaeodactylibacter luteus]
MKNYLKHDEWSIIEEGFTPEYNRISESIFSIGNGRFGQRANFEEHYSGDTLPGNYLAGIYYPDKTRVGWWKNGYPEYFAKVLNAANWIGIHVEFDGEALDLAKCEVETFRRELDMKAGVLRRSFIARLKSGRRVQVVSERFCSIAQDEVAALRYAITPLDFEGTLSLTPYIDFDVINEDSNYDEKFWVEVDKKVKRRQGYVLAETKKTAFQACTGMKFGITQNGKEADFNAYRMQREKYVGCTVDLECREGETTVVDKIVAQVTSLNYPKEDLMEECRRAVKAAFKQGFDALIAEQAAAWGRKWEEADIQIEGDVAAQQGIRFNIFQLYQTYTGEDERLNIGPKGFTGEKYGGSTYWDTEAYCLPFYLSTADEHVGRNLLVYRYKHLERAIENAGKLGFTGGAALYPMVTMNGEECHNEWEITFEEIHRNGAIAYAIYDYIRYTGDEGYLAEYGLEVLVGIARFWAQRAHFSKRRGQYVMHGVTGPNEYENNVNNNWYTNYIAKWCLSYAAQAVAYVEQSDPERYAALEEKMKFYRNTEMGQWKEIAENMYLPQDDELGILVQHDGFLDKELLTVDDLRPEDRPINQNWSWDRILRSVFIKQADVLQGLYFFEEDFDDDTLRRNFDFYEPRTVHESSLSPCVHAILAAKLGREEKAYEMYLRTARLDLDDYNNDTEDGCHITSMAGTWMAFVKGFGGLRVRDGHLQISPFLPAKWQSYAFKIRFRGYYLEVRAGNGKAALLNHSGAPITINLYGGPQEIPAQGKVEVPLQHQ